MAKTEKNSKDTKPVEISAKVERPAEPDELVIKEIMIQKNVTREKAIEILTNPTEK